LSGFNDGKTINGLLESIGLSNYRFNKYATQSQISKVKKSLNYLIKKGYVEESGLGYTITQSGADYLRSFDYGSYAKGGEVDTHVDLFEYYEKQPAKLSRIVKKYMKKFENDDYDYQDSENFLKEVQAIGYTFDYGLDNEPYGLRPVGVKLNELKGWEDMGEGDEYAKGGGVGEEYDLKVLSGLSGFNNGKTINGLLESIGLSNYRFNKYATQSQISKVKKSLNYLIKKGYVEESGLGYTITQSGADYLRSFDYGSYAKGGAMAEGEDYEYINSFGISDADFQDMVDRYHAGELPDTSLNDKYGEKTVHAAAAYIHAKHMNNQMRKGGRLGFEGLSRKVAEYYSGKKVPKQYQKTYGKTYDSKEAKEVGDKVASKVYRRQISKK
jgi:hypothetical protein